MKCLLLAKSLQHAQKSAFGFMFYENNNSFTLCFNVCKYLVNDVVNLVQYLPIRRLSAEQVF